MDKRDILYIKKKEGRIKMVQHFLSLSLFLSFNDRTTITLNRTIETERKKE
jgi:hypothetical protein